jgi:hypothetical protein
MGALLMACSYMERSAAGGNPVAPLIADSTSPERRFTARYAQQWLKIRKEIVTINRFCLNTSAARPHLALAL